MLEIGLEGIYIHVIVGFALAVWLGLEAGEDLGGGLGVH